jgi:FRG domain
LNMKHPISGFLARVIKLRDEWRDEDYTKYKECSKEGDVDFEPGSCWFRGVSNADYRLVPKQYRNTGYKLRKFQRKEPNYEETIYGFKSRAMQMMSEPHLPVSEKDWYFLMQHYGAPTRLLDWTDGALLALFFAVRELKEPRDAAVWMLDPSWLNEVANKIDGGVRLSEWAETDPWFPKPFDEVLHPALPLAVDPPHVARRLSVQRSHFTIHGTDKDGLDKMAEKENARLVKILVLAGDIVDVIDDLRTCGISETTVFPDLDALSIELLHEWCGE